MPEPSPTTRTALVTATDLTGFAANSLLCRAALGANALGVRAIDAWSRAWPEAKLVVVPDAGHSMTEPGIRSALIGESERFAHLR